MGLCSAVTCFLKEIKVTVSDKLKNHYECGWIIDHSVLIVSGFPQRGKETFLGVTKLTMKKKKNS